LCKKGAYGLFQAQGQRNYDFRTGSSLGKKDHIVKWLKPVKPSWMDIETYESYLDLIDVREFKINGRIYVTTLLNDRKYTRQGLVALYGLRWQVEVNLKSIKLIMKMDILSCKSPAMVKKDIGIHFLAYNLIRIMIAEACLVANFYYIPMILASKEPYNC